MTDDIEQGENDWLDSHSDEYREWVEAGSPEPTAADPYYDGEPCDYDDCDNEAEWIVEVEHSETFRCCDDCGRSNRIYPEELTGADVTVQTNR